MEASEVDVGLLVVAAAFGFISVSLGVTGIAQLSLRKSLLSLLLAFAAAGLLLTVLVTRLWT